MKDRTITGDVYHKKKATNYHLASLIIINQHAIQSN